MKAWAVNKSFDMQNRPCVTLRVADRTFLNSEFLDGRELDLSLKEFKPRRSLNANAYMWALIGKIAEAMRISQKEVYHRMLCDYGTYDLDMGVSQIISIKADAKLTGWLYIHTKPIKTVELNGRKFTHYALLKGSSEYDTKEMSFLLDGVIYEAKELGIEVLTEEELSRLNGYNHQTRENLFSTRL